MRAKARPQFAMEHPCIDLAKPRRRLSFFEPTIEAGNANSATKERRFEIAVLFHRRSLRLDARR
jgi:hypothetical protein